MGKVDTSKLRAQTREWKTIDIKDPATGDVYSLRMRWLDEMERTGAEEFGDKLIIRYMLGNFIDGVGDRQNAPEILTMIPEEDGSESPVALSEASLHYFAKLERMQGLKRDWLDDSPKEVYTAVDLARIAAMSLDGEDKDGNAIPSAWKQIRAFVRRVETEGGKKKANLKVLDGTSSGPGSTQDQGISA